MIFSETISNESVINLPKAIYQGRIRVVNTHQELEQSMPLLLNKEHIVGFDTETKPNFKKGKTNTIALLQLATPNFAMLVRLKEVGLPKAIVKLLENPNIMKVGAAIHDDLKSLKAVEPFNPQGFVDLQHIVKDYGIENLSVRKMAAIVLGKKVSKSQQLSNWESATLTEAQQQYAAIDAWICREIYLKLLTSKAKK
jgi:ribonuclease D